MTTTTDAARRSMPLLLWAATLAAILLGALCLAPTVGLYYENINPHEPRPGHLYMGDGTGFVLGTFFAIPALLSLATAVLVPLLWRRGKRDGAVALATIAAVLWVGLGLVWWSMWS